MRDDRWQSGDPVVPSLGGGAGPKAGASATSVCRIISGELGTNHRSVVGCCAAPCANSWHVRRQTAPRLSPGTLGRVPDLASAQSSCRRRMIVRVQRRPIVTTTAAVAGHLPRGNSRRKNDERHADAPLEIPPPHAPRPSLPMAPPRLKPPAHAAVSVPWCAQRGKAGGAGSAPAHRVGQLLRTMA